MLTLKYLRSINSRIFSASQHEMKYVIEKLIFIGSIFLNSTLRYFNKLYNASVLEEGL